jgi:ABC-type transport system involved in multi-copper enzyme maturation permease subunit
MSQVRTIGLVAGFDLYESLRSRKAIALILLYVVIAVGGTAIFASFVNRIFEQLAEQLGQQLGPAMIDRLLESEAVLEAVTKLAGDDEALARELLTIPPLALFYGWLITSFMPLIVVLSSADTISSEVSSGSARYALFRVDRLGWAAGKLLGQTLLMAVGVAVGGAACFAIGYLSLDHMKVAETAFWLARMSFRGIFYGFAYLGIAMCASQLVRGRAAALAVGVGLAFLASLLGGLFGADFMRRKAPALMDALHALFPNAHDISLYRPEIGARLIGSFALVAIGLAWFALGYFRLSRRDA